MTVSAPARPPRRTSYLVDAAELEALVEALIEEARLRARRRRRKYAGAVLLVAIAAVATFAAFQHASAGALKAPGAPTGTAAVFTRPAGTIAVTEGGSQEHTLLWTKRGVRDVGIEGRAFGWSPDGSRLLIRRGADLYVVRADGTDEVRIATGDGYNAVWSRDGTRIAFEAGPGSRSGLNSIYTIKADGTDVLRLPGHAVNGSFFSGNLTWSPDGRQILFAGRPAHNGRLSLYLVRTDGHGAPQRLPIPATMFRPMQPAWSPDGTRIAFSAGEAFSQQHFRGGIYLVHPDGTGLRWIAAGHGPVWSPNSSRLAFRGDGNQTVHADGTHLASLPPGSWAGLSWSPDSELIAFAGGEGHAPDGDVFVARSDGTHVVRLIHDPTRGFILPLWRGGTASTETG